MDVIMSSGNEHDDEFERGKLIYMLICPFYVSIRIIYIELYIGPRTTP